MGDQRLTRRSLIQTTLAGAVSATPAPAQAAEPLPAFHVSLEAAEARWDESSLTVSTGPVEFQWRLVENGLATSAVTFDGADSGFSDRVSGPFVANWSYPGLIYKNTKAVPRAITAKPVRFDPFTSDHIAVVAEFEYPSAALLLQYVIWAYPGAAGLRTQLRVKALPGFDPSRAQPGGHSAEFLPTLDSQRSVAGYFNHTQGRNKPETEIFREERVIGGEIDWASLAFNSGACVVKESHKCVNQAGVDTRGFALETRGIRNTGWGPSPQDFRQDRFRDCWASWIILYEGGEDGRERAIKRFDRARFPVDPKRDIYIMANTWGSGAAKPESLAASDEKNILRQIDSAADLGIDVQQIDDGWQGDNQYDQWSLWPQRYPGGWKNVRSAAKKAGVDLGLWAAWTIGRDELIETYDKGGFRYYKIDFAKLDTYDKLEELMTKMRELIVHSGYTVRVNWDVTENPARVGYYYARDLGNIYLENRKPMEPEHVVYHPYLVLRDAWQVAKYANLNRFQVTVQNPDRVNRDVSDAYLHPHPYTVAISLMASPIFFQETHYYSEEAREQIRPLLATYKQHRAEMYRGFVFPIGKKPDNTSWTGFQNVSPDSVSGYLTIFREIGAEAEEAKIRLRLVSWTEGLELTLIDLLNGGERRVELAEDGEVAFRIDEAPGFLFLRYELTYPGV